jgi:hypothetical protein
MTPPHKAQAVDKHKGSLLRRRKGKAEDGPGWFYLPRHALTKKIPHNPLNCVTSTQTDAMH